MSLDVRQLSRAVLGPVYYFSHRFGRSHVEHAYDRKSGIWSMYSAGADKVERNDLRSVYFFPRELRPHSSWRMIPSLPFFGGRGRFDLAKVHTFQDL